MKMIVHHLTVACVACSLTPFGMADDNRRGVDVQAGPVRVKVDADREARADTRTSRDRQGVVHRASNIEGMTVKNRAGKEVGEIHDIVIDVASGKVKYAAMSHGGILGVGDKLFAVPWTAFECRQDGDDAYLVLDVTEQQLEKAPGFDQDNWPDFGSKRFSDEVDSYYKSNGS